jgi:hypothetical protein
MDEKKTKSDDELLELIDATCDDRCDGEAVERLECLLRDEPDAVRTYVSYRDMHATLRWLTAPNGRTGTGSATGGVPHELHRPSSWMGRAWERGRYLTLAVAASLLLCCFSFWSGVHWADAAVDADHRNAANQGRSGAPDRGSATLGVARITGLVDCRWSKGQRPFQFGNWIASGDRVELTDGLLQLTFDSGAKVIIQGPVRFVPQSGMEARLDYGKLSAVVSESARGYTVKTPTAEVVDLGTEFALEVEGSGVTELHVLEGDVVARSRRPDGRLHGEAIQAGKHQALRFGKRPKAVERISADPGRFARQITPQLTREELPPLPVTDDLRFWVAADLLVSRRAGYVSAWRDVCVGDNQVGNDACQFVEDAQPLWIADASDGRPAIRFNGRSTRLTTDAFATGDQVSVFVVCSPDPSGQSNLQRGGQLVNFGGKAPTIEMTVHDDHTAYAGLWAANAVGQEITTGVIDEQRITPGTPSVLCYVYDGGADRAELWVNGHSNGSVPAPLSAKTTSTRTLGGHGLPEFTNRFYRGDLFEVLIYDAALDDAQRGAVIDYLRMRYSIGPSLDGASQAERSDVTLELRGGSAI